MSRYRGKYEAPKRERRRRDPDEPPETSEDRSEQGEPDQAPKPKRRGWLIAFCCLIALTLMLGGLSVAVLLRGSRMRSQAGPDLTGMAQSVQTSAEEESEPDPEPEEPVLEIIDSYTIRHDGVLYRYNEDVITLLLLGVDEDTPDLAGAVDGNGVQADMIMLAVMDSKGGTIRFLTLSRDTYCEFSMLDETGAETGQGTGQLALAFSYGDGRQSSCDNVRDAVSRLLYDIPIYSCSALYLDGLSVVNDALGGVTLTPSVTIPYSWPAITAGVETTLDAAMAEKYIRYREMTETGNLERMERQKQYCAALFSQAVAAVKASPTKVLDLYRALQSSLVTDLSLLDAAYLATQVTGMDFDGEIVSVPGEAILNEDNYVEFYPDRAALLDLILEYYFIPVDS